MTKLAKPMTIPSAASEKKRRAANKVNHRASTNAVVSKLHALLADRRKRTNDYDPSQPLSIFNHPPFDQMSPREIDELEKSWP
jgi:hypothetical protein